MQSTCNFLCLKHHLSRITIFVYLFIYFCTDSKKVCFSLDAKSIFFFFFLTCPHKGRVRREFKLVTLAYEAWFIAN
jgi:hypothetical protein